MAPTDIPFSDLLGADGCVRAVLRSTLKWGEWADTFCDAILTEMSKTHLEDFVLKFGAKNATAWPTKDGGVQLNVVWKDPGAYAVHIGQDFDAAVQQLWLQYAMLDRMNKETKNAQLTLSRDAAAASAAAILPWTG